MKMQDGMHEVLADVQDIPAAAAENQADHNLGEGGEGRELNTEARTEDGMHRFEVLPDVLDLPVAKNQTVENHLPATDKNLAAKNKTAHNLEEVREGRELTTEARNLVLQALPTRRCEEHIIRRMSNKEVGRALNICRHTISFLWKRDVECFE